MNTNPPCFIWRRPTTQGVAPQPRQGHSVIGYQNLMILFGGENEKCETLADLYVLDLETWRWSQPAVSGEIPAPRSFHTAVLHQEQMFVWGGCAQQIGGGYRFSDVDVHALDLKTWRWSRLTPTGSPPSARCHHSAALWQDLWLIHGGSYDMYSVWSDLHLLDFSRLHWRTLNVSNARETSLTGLKTQGGTLIKFLGDAAYGGFSPGIWTLDLSQLLTNADTNLTWKEASFQPIANYRYEVRLPPPGTSEVNVIHVAFGETAPDDNEPEMVDWGDGIPYRTVHGYGEVGDQLLLFAGMAPGDGVSHVTIGDLVALQAPAQTNAQENHYVWSVPKVEGEFPTPRFGHSILQYNDKTILFGGYWKDPYFGNDRFNGELFMLQRVSTSGS